jgi:hypothetical protein
MLKIDLLPVVDDAKVPITSCRREFVGGCYDDINVESYLLKFVVC